MKSAPEIAVTIPLTCWKDPQGNVVIHASRDGCTIYFGCWASAGVPADYLCRLVFHDSWAVRGVDMEFMPYEVREPHVRSSIYRVENSRWLKELTEQRSRHYPEWKSWDRREYVHYHVPGHDNYCEVIATGFEEIIVPEAEAGELAHLIWEA